MTRHSAWVGGATGFLGSHLVKALESSGAEVVPVSRSGGAGRARAVDVLDAEQVRASGAWPSWAFRRRATFSSRR